MPNNEKSKSRRDAPNQNSQQIKKMPYTYRDLYRKKRQSGARLDPGPLKDSGAGIDFNGTTGGLKKEMHDLP